MGLASYRQKRDFRVTPEPTGDAAPAGGHMFVVQKHAARRLHYDFRLEMDGVLKSWAVTRGPSLVAGTRRLAVHVEDHPLDYGGFEGVIPRGQYGGGTVEMWDRGTWIPLHDPAAGLAKGHLDFELHGEKLRGRWHLVRMRPRRPERRENWLLIKGEDDAARAASDPDILEEQPDSIATGRSIAQIAAGRIATGQIAAGQSAARQGTADTVTADGAAAPAAPGGLPGARAGTLPDFVAPALASLARLAPRGPQWLHEIKFDGYRLLARIDGGHVRLLTRTGLDWSDRFGPRLAAALAALPVRHALIDGELVVERPDGASDFSALQADLSAGRTDRFAFYAFDLLYLDGYDLQAAPLDARKGLLHRLVSAETGVLRFSAHFDVAGDAVLRQACRLGLEGVVSKLRNAPYRPGRSRDWMKTKCGARQEFVIGGYMPSRSAPRAIGSLVLGVHDAHDRSRLVHVGRAGTGFTADMARDLFRRLAPLTIPRSPFASPLTAVERRDIRYLRPELVAEIAFQGWTADGHVRQASFRGLREDKPAADIIREETPLAPTGRAMDLTHPDRLYWPEAGITKQDLAAYYAAIWPHIAPFITDRPLALLRCPTGIGGARFFQKHPWQGAGKPVVALHDPRAAAGERLIGIRDLDGLIALVQAASLEIHPWGATSRDWEHPDLIVMDLDPGEGVPWPAVVAAAREVRARLEQAGLAAFAKLSGGKGLHVVSPLAPRADWGMVKAFARGLAQDMAADSPGAYVATLSKARRHGRILIDYLRNQRGATAVAPYSPRARPGAPVATPVAWDELGPDIGPAHFTLGTIAARLAAPTADPWAAFHAAARPLEAARRTTGGRAGGGRA